MAKKERSLKYIKPNLQRLTENLNLQSKSTTKEERANMPGGENYPYDPKSGKYVKIGEAEPWTPPETPETTTAPPPPTMKGKGGKDIDISGSFSMSDFATPEDYEQAKRKAQSFAYGGAYAQEIQQQQAQFEAQQLAGQVGQFQQLGVEPTGLNFGQAATTGVVSGIPKALSWIGSAAVGGAAIGSKVGTSAGPVGIGAGALIGAAVGVLGGISGAMIGDLKSQRTDTTNAQKRVLDEGKQNLNDWATLAAADPANRALYIKNFNQQLALIDQAYRQMKLDTSRDVAKFETALPDLAEFEAFYMAQGERDFLVARMYQSLGVMQDPDYSYQMQELATRRGMYPNGTA